MTAKAPIPTSTPTAANRASKAFDICNFFRFMFVIHDSDEISG